MSEAAGMNLHKVFDQYLRHTTIPTLEYRFSGQQVQYRWVTDVKDFNMPVKVKLSDSGYKLIYPGTLWHSSNITLANMKDFKVDDNFYIITKEVK
jgi:hypothetical protein